MDVLTQEVLKTLTEAEGEWCVSIFMPTVRAGAEVQQNPIRLKNLLRTAEEQLKGVKLRAPDIDALLAPAQALLNDADLWRNIADGLAIFTGPDHFSMYRLPVNFEELVVVRQRFHIKPMLSLLSGDGLFYVLALSQDQIRLLECSRDSIDKIDLAGVPESLASALQYDQPQKMLRTASSSGGAVFGGGGADEEFYWDADSSGGGNFAVTDDFHINNTGQLYGTGQIVSIYNSNAFAAGNGTAADIRAYVFNDDDTDCAFYWTEATDDVHLHGQGTYCGMILEQAATLTALQIKGTGTAQSADVQFTDSDLSDNFTLRQADSNFYFIGNGCLSMREKKDREGQPSRVTYRTTSC